MVCSIVRFMSVLVLSLFCMYRLYCVRLKKLSGHLLGNGCSPVYHTFSLYLDNICYFTYFLFMFRGHGVPVPGDCLLHWFLHYVTF